MDWVGALCVGDGGDVRAAAECRKHDDDHRVFIYEVLKWQLLRIADLYSLILK